MDAVGTQIGAGRAVRGRLVGRVPTGSQGKRPSTRTLRPPRRRPRTPAGTRGADGEGGGAGPRLRRQGPETLLPVAGAEALGTLSPVTLSGPDPPHAKQMFLLDVLVATGTLKRAQREVVVIAAVGGSGQ